MYTLHVYTACIHYMLKHPKVLAIQRHLHYFANNLISLHSLIFEVNLSLFNITIFLKSSQNFSAIVARDLFFMADTCLRCWKSSRFLGHWSVA